MAIRSYRIGEMPPQIPAEAAALLTKVEAATIGHYLHDRFCDAGLRPVIEGRRVAGTAVTVSLPGPDSTLLYYAMDRVRPGDVLVIDRGGDLKQACWGGFMAAVAALRGLGGVIIDGVVTDPADIRRHEVPTWARGVSAITTKLLNIGGGFNIPVGCGGLAVVPGDAILADDCGILVVPPAEVDGLTRLALADQADEGQWLARIRPGFRMNDMVDVEAMIAERGTKDEAAHG
jgi:regulator of RNase E activity RraA